MTKVEIILKPYIRAYCEGIKEEMKKELSQARQQICEEIEKGMPKKMEYVGGASKSEISFYNQAITDCLSAIKKTMEVE